MADYMWRLELPSDRHRFTVAEVLEATGKALHPDPELGAPVMIRDIRKAPDGWGTPGHAPHPVQLESEDWERLQLIWSRMDAPQFPMTEAAWQPYLDAFHNSPNRPKGWSLTAIQRDPELQTELKRAFALQAHREKLKAAVNGGTVKVRNPITGEVADFDWQEHQDDWLMSREQFKTLCDLLSIELVEAHVLPSFGIPVRPVVVPSALRTLNPAERVRYEHGASCGISGSGIGSAGDLVEVFEDLIARQREGAFTLDESAHLIAEAQGFDSKGFRQRLEEAYRAGTLTVRAPDTELPRKPSESWRPHSDIVKVDDLNAWLKAQGVRYSFPEVKTFSSGLSGLLHIRSEDRHFALAQVPEMTARALVPDADTRAPAGSRHFQDGTDDTGGAELRLLYAVLLQEHRGLLTDAIARREIAAPWVRLTPNDEPQQALSVADLRAFCLRLNIDVVAAGDEGIKLPSKTGARTRAAKPMVHKLKSRVHALSAVIEKASQSAADPTDYQSVWAALVRIAQSPERPAPVIGYVDAEGVQYQTAEREEPKYFTKKALKERFSRAQAR